MNTPIDTTASYDDVIVVFDEMFDTKIPVPTEIYEKACMKNDTLELHEYIQEHFKHFYEYRFDSVLIHLDKRRITTTTHPYSICKVTFCVSKKKLAEDKYIPKENIESIKVSTLQKKLKPAVPMLVNMKESA